jgi:glycerol-3-phosphate dehydrogenase
MVRDLNKLTNTEYDVIIIGGGIFGACALWEAAHRGLSACLVEKGDFCEATSANHYKMVHGGIRYIQHGDIPRLRESSIERSAFLRIAPHMVTPLPVVIPTYGHGMKGKEILRLGMFLYDSFTADRNYKIPDKDRKIPFCYSISKEKVQQLFPGIKSEGLTGAAIFNDAQMYNPPRLALSFIKSACSLGADAANYVQAEQLLFSDNKCFGVLAKDSISSEVFSIKGKIILNTAGPWAYNFLRKSGITLKSKPSFSRDTAFVLNRPALNQFALATTLKTKDVDSVIDRGGRHVFIVPWLNRNRLMIGVWHVVWGKTEYKVFVTENEINEFISEVNEAYPKLELKREDIAFVNTGLTLFGERTPGSKRMSFGKRSLLIDHKTSDGMDGIVTLIGVRATMGRAMAEQAINLISQKLEKEIPESKSKYFPLYGGDFSSFKSLESEIYSRWGNVIDKNALKALAHNYGSKYDEVLNEVRNDNRLAKLIGNSDVTKAEVIYCIRNEMALKLKDIVMRRTNLGTAGYPGKENLEICADIMAGELKWSAEKKSKELDEAEEYYYKQGSVKLYSPNYEYAN